MLNELNEEEYRYPIHTQFKKPDRFKYDKEIVSGYEDTRLKVYADDSGIVLGNKKKKDAKEVSNLLSQNGVENIILKGSDNIFVLDDTFLVTQVMTILEDNGITIIDLKDYRNKPADRKPWYGKVKVPLGMKLKKKVASYF